MPGSGGRNRGRSRSRIKLDYKADEKDLLKSVTSSAPFAKPEEVSKSKAEGKRTKNSKKKKISNNLDLGTESKASENENSSSSSDEEKSSVYSSIVETDTPVTQQQNQQGRNIITKYSSKDNGPFVVYAKQERIKEITLARDLKKSGICNIHNIYKVNDNIMKIVFKDKVNANRTMEIDSMKIYMGFSFPKCTPQRMG